MVLDRLANFWQINFQRENPLSLVARKHLSEQEIVLVKPLTYMNLSGNVLPHFFSVSPENTSWRESFLVICDEIMLPLGRIRFRPSGSTGGHNGLKSIEAVLGQEYARLRLGVGSLDPFERDLKERVLNDFPRHQQPLLEKVLETAKSAVQDWIEYGITFSMNRYNGVEIAPPSSIDTSS